MAVNLKDIGDMAKTAIDQTELKLDAALGLLDEDATAGELLEFQMYLAKNSLTTATYSSLAKERVDTLKQVVQKF